MPNRSIRDMRQNAPMVAPSLRPAASPVMGQPMSRPVLTAPIANPTPIGVANRATRSQIPTQLTAGPVPEAASVAAGAQAPNQIATQPRAPVPTMRGPGGAIPRPMVR